MRTAVLHPLAAREVRAAYDWYARRSRKAAERFRQAVQNSLQLIEANPEIGSPFRTVYRWLAVRRFPFVLYYEIYSHTAVLVYAVAHTKRRLGYWLRRSRS